MPMLRRSHDRPQDIRAWPQCPRTALDANAMSSNPSPDCNTAKGAHRRRLGRFVQLRSRASAAQPTTLKSSALQRPHRNLRGPHVPWPLAEDLRPPRQTRLSGPSGPGVTVKSHRPETCDLHPAGSFPGGFQTPAPVHLAASVMAGIRNPSQEETFRVHGIPHAQSSTAYRQNFAEGRS
jgi:hypothetical protein